MSIFRLSAAEPDRTVALIGSIERTGPARGNVAQRPHAFVEGTVFF